jgi:hypothetical protein
MKTKRLLQTSKVQKLSKKEAEKVKKGSKRVSVSINRITWINQHSLALKYPLSTRLAAWLKLGGVDSRRFDKEYHLDESGISKAVLAALINFDLEKGPEADRIPPLLPVYLKVEPKTEADIAPSKRPSTEESVKKADAIRKSLLAAGWTSEDVKYAFREVIGDNNLVPRRIKSLAIDFGDELDSRTVKPSISAVSAKTVKTKIITEPVPEPVVAVKESVGVVGQGESVAKPTCRFCGGPTVRDTTFHEGKPVHRACLTMSKPGSFDETVQDPNTGHAMRWDAGSGKWVRYSSA